MFGPFAGPLYVSRINRADRDEDGERARENQLEGRVLGRRGGGTRPEGDGKNREVGEGTRQI